jgi:tetratricopeptide (TPR) repeat protein
LTLLELKRYFIHSIMIRIQSLLTGEYREAPTPATATPTTSTARITPSSSYWSPSRGVGFFWQNSSNKRNAQSQQPPNTDAACRTKKVEEEASVTSEEYEEEEDEITTIEEEEGDSKQTSGTFSMSSTQPGDSFVQSIGTRDEYLAGGTTAVISMNITTPTMQHRQKTMTMMDSPTDPYLECKEEIRKRLWKSPSKDRQPPPPFSSSPIRSVTRILLGGSSPPVSSRLDTSRHSLDSLVGSNPDSSQSTSCYTNSKLPLQKKKTPNHASPGSKSMGSFSFPPPSDECDDEEEQDDDEKARVVGTIRYLAIPKSMDFGRSSRSVKSEQTDLNITTDPPNDTSTEQETGENDSPKANNDSMYVETETSIGNIIPLTIAKPVTPSRKKRILARQRVAQIQQQLSESSQPIRTAYLFLELGKTYMMPLHRYLEAISAFFQAAAIFRHLNHNVAMATALDYAAQTYGLARQRGHADMIHDYHEMTRFEMCLWEAWKHRNAELGPYHIDTVDTLQHLAQHYIIIEQPQRALELFSKVVSIRQSMFGPDHPSIAVLAHCLGNAHLQSHNVAAAEQWYGVALEIYNLLQLPNQNPAVQKLLEDRKRLQRVQRWMMEEEEDTRQQQQQQEDSNP